MTSVSNSSRLSVRFFAQSVPKFCSQHIVFGSPGGDQSIETSNFGLLFRARINCPKYLREGYFWLPERRISVFHWVGVPASQHCGIPSQDAEIQTQLSSLPTLKDHFSGSTRLNPMDQGHQDFYCLDHARFEAPERTQPSGYLFRDNGPTEPSGSGPSRSGTSSFTNNGPYSSPWPGEEPMVRQSQLSDPYQLQLRALAAEPPATAVNNYGSFGTMPYYLPSDVHINSSFPFSPGGMRRASEQTPITLPDQENQQGTFHHPCLDPRYGNQYHGGNTLAQNLGYQPTLSPTQPSQILHGPSVTTVYTQANHDLLNPSNKIVIPSHSSTPARPHDLSPTWRPRWTKDVPLSSAEEQGLSSSLSGLNTAYGRINSIPGNMSAMPGLAGSQLVNASRIRGAVHAKRNRSPSVDQVERQTSPPAKVKRFKRRFSATEKAKIAYKRKNKLVDDECRRAHRKVGGFTTNVP